MSNRRSTRLTRASAEPTQPAEAALQRRVEAVESPHASVRKTRSKAKAVRSATSSQLESFQSATVKTQLQSASKVTSTSRVITASTPTSAVTTVSKRNTRVTRAAAADSPLRMPASSEKKRKRIARGQTASATPEPAQSEAAQDDESDEQQIGAFFSKKFDNDLMHVEEPSPVRPTFVNGNESAIALLNKIENAAKETARTEPSTHIEIANNADNDVDMENSSGHVTNHDRTTHNATPARPMATPSGFFTRSFSALKSIFLTPTPKAPAPEAASSPTPSKALPAPNSFTESLSVPPTPVGERVKTPAKKKKTNHLLKALLKGVEHHERAKAEEWAKHVLPALKNDRAFREKRKRLETPVLVKDLNHFPSAKPWETGFGDPLADLDDEDIVPVWAVYLDMMAEAEEPQTKKNKTTHDAATDDDDVLSINEQFAASQGASPSPKLHNSRGHSASLFDLHPRRSIEPSPLFATPVSHQQGENIFSELQGHDNAAQIRANEREFLQDATHKTVHASSTVGASFSVPDDSDEEDSTIISETSVLEDSSAWTQAPPPAPVPAHAALPGASTDSSVDVPTASAAHQPVDEVERQRQKLMKHTPAKPSRLREATYPSPSLLSDAGNESILAGTPIQFAPSVAHLFDDMPVAESIELDADMQADFDALVNSVEYKQQLAANPWPSATLVYESDEEGLSPN